MPRRLDYGLLKLKARYTTSSHEVIALRFLDLPESCVVTVIDNDHVSRRRSNGPRCVARELAPRPSKQCQQYGQPSRSASGRSGPDGISVRGLAPVHTPDWKREILRSTFDSDA